jgi:hypothetical protein
MPFFYDETNIEWPEDGSDPPPPRADQFMYMTAAEYWGEPAEARAPARFLITPFDDAELEPSSPAETAPPRPAERGGFLRRLFGGGRSEDAQQQRRSQIEHNMRRSMLLQRKRTQQLFSTMVPALRSLGVRRAYCRYDGGNDEGFCWLDRYETDSDERIDTGPLAKRLYEMGMHDKLRAAGFADHLKGTSADQKISEIEGFACGWLINDWAWVLLGNYGAGEYSMYGAFTVDLDECSVTDDPKAAPIVQNITIAS